MADQRLPIVNGDDAIWGTILNQFLEKEHYNTGADLPANGGHKTITVRAGTTGAGTAPLKFTSGSLMTAAEAGAVEFLTDKLYYTQTTSTIRRTIASYAEGTGADGDLYYRSSGVFTPLPIGTNNYVLTSNGTVPSWQPAAGGGSGLTQQQVMAISSMRI